MKPKYQAPSLAGVYVPPVMASFADGHYQYNGLRGADSDSESFRKWLYLGAGLFAGYLLVKSISEK